SMPQTVKNTDKAIAKIVLAIGENLEARIRQNTGKAKARGKIEIEGMYRTADERRKLENRIGTTKEGIEELEWNPGKTDASSEIEDDWLNLFARLSEDKSSEELQRLFGRILSGEIRRPGSFSLRTLQLMATISKTDAEAVTKFLSYAIDGVVPFGVESQSPTIHERVLMEELGVAGHDSQIGGIAVGVGVAPGAKNLFRGSESGILVENNAAKEVTVSLPGQVLTTSGKELIPIAGSPSTDLEFLKRVAGDIRLGLMGAYSADLSAGLILVHVVTTTTLDFKTYQYVIVFTAG